MKKLILSLEIFVLTFLLQASSCTDEAIKKATNDGSKSLVETKVTPIVRDFLNIVVGSSNTFTGKIDLSNAGMGDVVHIDTFTINVPFKFNIPINATFPITVNIPSMVVLLVTVVILFILFPYVLIAVLFLKKK